MIFNLNFSYVNEYISFSSSVKFKLFFLNLKNDSFILLADIEPILDWNIGLFSTGKGEGQLIGELLYPKGPSEIYRAPKVVRKAKDSAEIRRIGDEIIGENNLRRKGACE